jgi:hypothetical protein
MYIIITHGGNIYLCKDKESVIHQGALLMHASVDFKILTIHSFVFMN